MKYRVLLFCLFFIANASAQTTNPNYNQELASSLGADVYGMKNYVFVLLKTGTNKASDKEFIDACFAGHMANITRLVNEKKIIIAGPIAKNSNNYRGLFVFDVKTLDEAELLLKSDPAVESGLLDAELFSWYGSAALPLYLPASDKIWQQKP